MEKNEIFLKIRALVADTVGLEEAEIKMESRFMHDLGCDSLLLSELIMIFEDNFKLRVSDQEAEKMITINAVVEYIFANQNR